MVGAVVVGVGLGLIVPVAKIKGDGELDGVGVIYGVEGNVGFTLAVQEIIIVFRRIRKNILILFRLTFFREGSNAILFVPFFSWMIF